MSKIVTLRDQIFEGIADFFGCDPAYYDVDGWALADSIISHTEIQKGDLRRYVVSDKFVFEYESIQELYVLVHALLSQMSDNPKGDTLWN